MNNDFDAEMKHLLEKARQGNTDAAQMLLTGTGNVLEDDRSADRPEVDSSH